MKHIVVGSVFIVLGLWGMIAWWASFGLVMRGVIPFFLLAAGLVGVLSGYYRLGKHLEEDEGE